MLVSLALVVMAIYGRPWGNEVPSNTTRPRRVVTGAADPGPQELNEAQAAVKERLEALVAGDGDWGTFSITYSDLHGLHGGIAITIDGSGEVTQEARYEAIGQARQVSAEDLKALATQLCELRIWEQWVPDRSPELDESAAWIGITCGNDQIRTWEWYNDMQDCKRIIVIREAMKMAAWKPASSD